MQKAFSTFVLPQTKCNMKKDKWVMGHVYLVNNTETPFQEKYDDFLERLYPDSGAPVDTLILLIPDADSDRSFKVAFTRRGVSFEKI